MSDRRPAAEITTAHALPSTPAAVRAADPMTAPTTTKPIPATLSPVRASDVDRSDTVVRLHQALGEGRLDLAETDERVAAAYAARYRSELAPLPADLPDSSGPTAWQSTGPPAWNAIWSGLVWRAHGIVFPVGSDKP